jgi:hypothetical protein
MRAHFSRLLSLAFLLVVLCGVQPASAHPCHEAPAPTMAHPTLAKEASAHRAVLRIASPETNIGRLAPCHCPNGRGDCHGHCVGISGVALPIADAAVLDLSPDRILVAFGDARNGAGWVPAADIDPPRHSA